MSVDGRTLDIGGDREDPSSHGMSYGVKLCYSLFEPERPDTLGKRNGSRGHEELEILVLWENFREALDEHCAEATSLEECAQQERSKGEGY